mmetsp:Transcript_18233/g.73047  ORF Transcript_18233/g.73047 Transcript_18233/m.73047 type:complete len:114 (-) Transcript_18233:2618-2959(-)
MTLHDFVLKSSLGAGSVFMYAMKQEQVQCSNKGGIDDQAGSQFFVTTSSYTAHTSQRDQSLSTSRKGLSAALTGSRQGPGGSSRTIPDALDYNPDCLETNWNAVDDVPVLRVS